MRKPLFYILFFTVLTSISSAKNPKDYTFYDDLSPAKRKELAKTWLDTGKAFYSAGKKNQAKASFLFSFYFYPMGSSSKEACALLKDYFNETLSYNSNQFFTIYMNRGKQLSKNSKKVNNYLMALEIKPGDPDANYETAKAYFDSGDKENAWIYLKKAIKYGYDTKKIPQKLNAIIQ
jgi:tetratricopeptide (TPR) repeat protein